MENILLAQENVDVYVAETGIAGGGDPLAGSQAAHIRPESPSTPRPKYREAGEKIRVEPTTETIERIRELAAEILALNLQSQKRKWGPP